VLFVLASHGDAPQWLVALSLNRVPARAILAGSAFGYLAMAAAVLSPQLVFSFLVNASGALILFIYLMLCIAQMRERNALVSRGAPLPAIRMWLHPWSTYAVMLGIAAVLVAMALTPALASQLYSSLFVTALVYVFYLVKDRRDKHSKVCKSAAA
jgi:L-asparagine transporter-like permease